MIDLFNGQVWKQDDLPCMKVVLLLLPGGHGESCFAMLGYTGDTVAMIRTIHSGQWRFTPNQLIAFLEQHNYRHAGWMRVNCSEGDGEPFCSPELSARIRARTGG